MKGEKIFYLVFTEMQMCDPRPGPALGQISIFFGSALYI